MATPQRRIREINEKITVLKDLIGRSRDDIARLKMERDELRSHLPPKVVSGAE